MNILVLGISLATVDASVACEDGSDVRYGLSLATLRGSASCALGEPRARMHKPFPSVFSVCACVQASPHQALSSQDVCFLAVY